MHPLTLVTLAGALFLLPTALAQPKDPPAQSDAHLSPLQVVRDADSISITVDSDGLLILDLITLCREETGYSFNYEPIDLKDLRVYFDGTQTMPNSKFFAFFQDALHLRDLVLLGIPSSVGASGPTTYAVRKSSGGSATARQGYIKTQAPFVPIDALEQHRDDSAMVFTTSIPLRHVNAQEATNTLQAYFTDPQLESVRAVTNSNSLVLTGFGPTLCTMKALAAVLDAEPSAGERTTAVVPLKYASAAEVEKAIAEHVNQPSSNLPPGLLHDVPTISFDARTNSLLISGNSVTVENLKLLVAGLDRAVPADPPKSTIVKLTSGDANEIASTMSAWAAGFDSPVVGSRPDGTPIRGSSQFSFVAHVPTNAIVVRMPTSQSAEVMALIQQLDQPAK